MQHAKAGQRHRPRIPTVLKSSQAMTQSLTTGLSNFHCSILNVSYLKSMSCLKRFFMHKLQINDAIFWPKPSSSKPLSCEGKTQSSAQPHTHTRTPEGLSWPVRRQNLPIVMLVTFLRRWSCVDCNQSPFSCKPSQVFFLFIRSVISYEWMHNKGVSVCIITKPQ